MIKNACRMCSTMERQKKTSIHHDGNTTRNQQTSSHNDKTSPQNDKTTTMKTTPHNNVAPVNYDKTPKRPDKTSRPKKKNGMKGVVSKETVVLRQSDLL